MSEPMIVEEYVGGACPTQSEGSIDGKPYYFRARHGQWRLEVGGEIVAEGGDPTGGWMDDEAVRAIIRNWAAPSPSPVVEVTVTAEMVTEALSAFYTPRPWPARTKAEKRGAMRHALIAALSAR